MAKNIHTITRTAAMMHADEQFGRTTATKQVIEINK